MHIVNTSHHPLPAYETAGAAGMDLRAYLPDGPVTLQPMERRAIPTGLYVALDAGFEGQVRPRSGLSLRRGLTVVNAPGTVDADYRGEVMIPLINLDTDPQTIADGDRIAQLVVARYERVTWRPVEALPPSESTRGTGGFGSTGAQ